MSARRCITCGNRIIRPPLFPVTSDYRALVDRVCGRCSPSRGRADRLQAFRLTERVGRAQISRSSQSGSQVRSREVRNA